MVPLSIEQSFYNSRILQFGTETMTEYDKLNNNGIECNLKEQCNGTISSFIFIRITCLCNVNSLTPHFYTVKKGFTWVYIFFLIFAQNIDCGYSLEPPQYMFAQNIHCGYSLEPLH